MNAFAAAVVVLSLASTPAQNGVDAARQLYAAAAFDEALAALTKLGESPDLTPADLRQVDEYRMFSLYALGRAADAEAVAETLLRRDPLMSLQSSDASPRLQAAFKGVRTRLLPVLVRERYRAGRAAVEGKDFADAARAFTDAQQLIDEAEKSMVSDSGLADLRVLVDGFLVLSTSRRPDAPDATDTTQATSALRLEAALPPADSATAEKSFYSLEDVDVVPPAVVSQVVPNVPDAIRPEVMRAGRPLVITVEIDPAGRVRRASIVVSVNPYYDEMVVSSTSRWRYKPATRSGVPVPYQKVIAIAVR